MLTLTLTLTLNPKVRALLRVLAADKGRREASITQRLREVRVRVRVGVRARAGARVSVTRRLREVGCG